MFGYVYYGPENLYLIEQQRENAVWKDTWTAEQSEPICFTTETMATSNILSVWTGGLQKVPRPQSSLLLGH